jgi:hypothetical protein
VSWCERTRAQANQAAEAWRASERRHLTQRREAHRAEWVRYHRAQAEAILSAARSLALEHERKALELEGGEMGGW